MRKFRVYFNRHSEKPQVWSVDEGSQASEINVKGWYMLPGCIAEGRYNGEKPNEDTPCAWVQVIADDYYIKDGEVYFMRLPADGRG